MSENPQGSQEITPAGTVLNDERLNRRIPDRAENWHLVDGKLHPSSQAFSDRENRPSVDRAHINGHDAAMTQADPSDGVAQVIAGAVRQVTEYKYDKAGKRLEDQTYAADIEPRPLPENPAHAEICPHPDYDERKVWRRVLEAIGRLADWPILPGSQRP